MSNSMHRGDVLGKFAAIVAESLSIDVEEVKEDSTLEELGAQSLDVVEISMETESAFNVWLPDKSILDVAIDAAGRDVMLDGKLLSEFGKDLFRARLARDEWGLLKGDVTVADLQQYFMRVSTWVRMIEDLREHTPKACAECKHGDLSDRPGFVLACDSCGHEMKLRSGEEINRDWVESYLAAHGSAVVDRGTAAEGSARQ